MRKYFVVSLVKNGLLGGGLVVDNADAVVKVLNTIILGNSSTDGVDTVWNAADIIVKEGIYKDAYTLAGGVQINGQEIVSGKETGAYSYYGLDIDEVFDTNTISQIIQQTGLHDFHVYNNGVLTFGTASLAYRNGIQVKVSDGKVYYGASKDPFITLASGINAFSGNFFNPIYDQNGTRRTDYTAVGAWNGNLTRNIFLTTEYRTKKEAIIEDGNIVGYKDVVVDWYVEDVFGQMKFNCAGFEYWLESAQEYVDMKGWRVETPGRLSTFTVRAGDVLNINEGPAIEIGALIVEGSQVIEEDPVGAAARGDAYVFVDRYANILINNTVINNSNGMFYDAEGNALYREAGIVVDGIIQYTAETRMESAETASMVYHNTSISDITLAVGTYGRLEIRKTGNVGLYAGGYTFAQDL